MEKRYSYIRYFMMTAVLCLLFITAIPVRAAVSVTYPVTYQQTSARAVVTYVNQLRQAGSWYWNESNTSKIATGTLNAVTYDYDLEKAAMQRAAEIALYYDHTRPNGSSCFTAYNAGTASAENIAAGYTTAAEVYNGWLEENKNYAGQGHRRGMLKNNVTAIGMGHVICNGVHYWVMELRAPVASPNTATSAVNATQNVTVQAENSYLDGVQLSVPAYEQMTIGESYTLAPQLLLKGKNVNGWETKVPVQASYTVTSSDSSVLKCTAQGSGLWKMEAPGAGTSTLTVSSSSSVGSPSLSFTVTVGKVNMDYAEISLAQKEYTWNGSAVCPKPVITYHGEVLKEGVDYTLSYLRNGGCTRNNGGAIVSAFAISSGRFSGYRSIGFNILAADIGKQKISLSPAEYVYDGMLKEPEVIIPGLVKNKDFRVEYQNNLSVGTAKAVVSGLGNYTGRTTVTFTIRSKNSAASSESQKSTAVSLKRPVISSAVNKKGKKIKITWKKQSGVTGYQIRYKTGKKTKTIKVKKSSTTTKTISGLKKGKTYTITLRSYKNSDGKTIYSAWSKKKKVKVKK